MTTMNAHELRTRAIQARDRGSIDLALELLDQAVAGVPDDAVVRAERGLTLMLTGDLQAAEDDFRAVEELQPGNPDVLTNLAALLQHRGHLQEAIAIYRRVLDADEDAVEVRCNLAKALADCGDNVTALVEADIAVSKSKGMRGSLATRGAVLIDAGNYTAALDTLMRAVEKEPAVDMTLVNLALCSQELDDLQSTITYLIRAVELNPHNARAVADLVNALSACGDDEQALSLANGFLREHPGERLVVAALAQALLNAGDTDRAVALTDFDDLVRVIDVETPPSFAHLDEFNTAITRELLHEPSLLRDPVNKATTGGAQTGELDLRSSTAKIAFAALANDAVSEAVSAYSQLGLADHPVMLPATENWSLRVWGTIIDAGGQQAPHMHPLGWLSAVYYAELPASMDGSDESGWLEFGRPPSRVHCKIQPHTRRYEPRPGRVIVFPSWFWHRTLPFASSGETSHAHSTPRISIAFDALPTHRLGQL